jgi:hypothetical protein
MVALCCAMPEKLKPVIMLNSANVFANPCRMFVERNKPDEIFIKFLSTF